MELVHTVGRHVELGHERGLLFRYVYQPETPATESPRPYFHPLRTLAGDTVTIFRPHDHLWHHGLSMTSAHLSGQNFWGGPTFVRDQGYQRLPDHGRMEHVAWEEMAPERMVERLRWVTEAGERWMDEERRIGLAAFDAGQGWWALDLEFRLTNVSGRDLAWGSPTTQGRPAAGYGGLFWRGPREFTNGTILAAGDLGGPGVMGARSPWLAYSGRHDGSANASTVVMIDAPGNPRHPTRWFVRSDPYGCASAAFMFDREYPLARGDQLALRYVVVIADGAWSRDRIGEVVSELGFEGG
jgi:Methane oxygenase PmoA